MGQMHFLAPARERQLERAVDRAYMAGMDGVPWLSRNWIDGDRLIIQRAIDESGSLFIPWTIEGHGEFVLSTTTLIARDEPFDLVVELARGTVGRVRNQVAEWEPFGFVPSGELQQCLDAATAKLVCAVTSKAEPADDAEQAIAHGLDAIRRLAVDFAAQMQAIWRNNSSNSVVLLGCSLGTSPPTGTRAVAFGEAFNAGVIPFNWRDIEADEGDRRWDDVDKAIRWCRAAGLKTCSGPLFRPVPHCVPDWLYLWDDDFESIRSYVLGQVEAAIERYQGKVQLWQAAAAMSTGKALTLSEAERLHLAAELADRIRRADDRAPILITFDQPWAESMAHAERELPPWSFADELVRADLGLSGIGLEINLGYWPGGTLRRDTLEFGRLIDRWCELDLPLVVLLTIPSDESNDEHAHRSAAPIAGVMPGGWTSESQKRLVEELIPFLLAKPAVQGVIWNQLSDAQPHEFAHGGLIDARGAAKPALDVLTTLHRQQLGS